MPISKEERVRRGLVGKKTYYNPDGVRIDIDWDDEELIIPTKEESDERRLMEKSKKKGLVGKILSDGTEVLEEKDIKYV